MNSKLMLATTALAVVIIISGCVKLRNPIIIDPADSTPVAAESTPAAAPAKPATPAQPTTTTPSQPTPAPATQTPAQQAPAKPAAAAQQPSQAPATGFRTPYTVPDNQPSAIQAQRSHIGLNVWQGRQLDLNALPALGTNEWYLAHGDVAGNGSCQVWVWKTGRPTGLSATTWQLYIIRAASEAALNDAVAVEQQIAERESSPCGVVYR